MEGCYIDGIHIIKTVWVIVPGYTAIYPPLFTKKTSFSSDLDMTTVALAFLAEAKPATNLADMSPVPNIAHLNIFTTSHPIGLPR